MKQIKVWATVGVLVGSGLGYVFVPEAREDLSKLVVLIVKAWLGA